MATDSVSIKLSGDAAGLINSLHDVQQSVGTLTDSVGSLGKSFNAFGLVGGFVAAKSAVMELSSAVGVSVAALTGAAAVGAAINYTISSMAASIEESARAMLKLGESSELAFRKITDSVKAANAEALLSAEDLHKYLRGSAELYTHQDLAALKKMAAEVKDLIEAGRKMRVDQEASFTVGRTRKASRVGLQEAAGSLLDTDTRGNGRSPEEQAEAFKATAIQINKAKLAELEELEKQSQNRLEDYAEAGLENQKLIETANFEAIQDRKTALEFAHQQKIAEIDAAAREARKALDQAAAEELATQEQKDLDAIDEKNRLLREQFEIQRQIIEGSEYLSESQKRSGIMASLEAQNSALPDDPKSKAARLELARMKSNADPNSFKDQTVKALVELQNQIGTFSQASARFISNGIGAAMNGLTDGITGAITGTKSWGQVWEEVGLQMIHMFVGLIVQAIELFAVLELLNAIVPGLGDLLALSAKGLNNVPGKASGGIVSHGIYQLGEQGTEYVVNAPTLQKYGQGYFDALQAGSTPPAAGGSATNIKMAFINEGSAYHDFLQSRDGEKIVVDIMSRNIHHFR